MWTIDDATATVRGGLGEVAAGARIAVVSGSGLGALLGLGDEIGRIDYAAIPGVGAGTVSGHAGRWVTLRTTHGLVHCLAGRRHLYEGIEPAATALLMRVAARLGVRTVILTNAAGGLVPRLVPGDLMRIDDHINLMNRNPLIGPHDVRLGPRFPDMSEPYDRDLACRLHAAAERLGIVLQQGVYIGLSGPTYETPAEVRMLQWVGGDAVGMSTVPEVIAARQAGMRVVAISLITNSHTSQAETTHEEVLEKGQEAAGKLCRLLGEYLGEIS